MARSKKKLSEELGFPKKGLKEEEIDKAMKIASEDALIPTGELVDIEVVEPVEVKEEEEVPKKALFSKEFGPGHFHGNTHAEQLAIAKELAVQNIADGSWVVDTTSKANGVTILYIIQSKK